MTAHCCVLCCVAGGESWAAWWYLEDRQPEIDVGTNFESLVSDVAGPNPTGMLYFGHPGAANGSLARANYTVHKSGDGGASWEFVDVVYGGGAGYSDIHLLGDGFLGVAFQKTWNPPDPHTCVPALLLHASLRAAYLS